MANVTAIRKITLDVSRQNEMVINVKQGDENSRYLNIKVTNVGNVISIPPDTVVTLNARNFAGDYANSMGEVDADGTVTVLFTPAMTATPGRGKADIQFIGSGGERLSALNFIYYAEEQAVPDGAVITDSNYSALVGALAEVAGFAGVKAEVETARGTYESVDARLDENDLSVGNKVDKVAGKGLSTNDYDNAEKSQVATNKSDISTLDEGLTGALDRITDAETSISTAQTDINSLKQQSMSADLELLALQNTLANMGDGRVTVDGGYGNISALSKTAAIAAMNAILYGATATNLVVNGDFSNGTTGWGAAYAVNAIVDGNLVNTGNGAAAYPQANYNYVFIDNNVYYIKSNINLAQSATRIMIQTAKDGANFTIVTKESPSVGSYILSGIFTASASSGLKIMHYYTPSELANGAKMTILGGKDGVVCVNLTATGETGLTLAQLDAKYANYFSGTQSAQVTCLESKDKDGKLVGEQYIEPKTTYRVPNGVACSIDTSKNEHTQRVKRHVLTADNVKSISNQTNVQFINLDISGREPSGAASQINYKTLIPGYTEIVSGSRDTAGNNKMFYTYGSAVFDIVMPLGTYANLTAAKTALAGTVIYYQLATPIITQSIVTGNLLSRPGGTIQFSNKHSFASLVANGVLPTRTWYADIGTVERLEKLNADGTLTPLDASLAVISADKRSITHPQLVNGDMARCKYSYTFAGVNGRKDINYLNAQNLVLGADGKYYKIGFAVDAAGAISLTKTEEK